MRYNTILPQNKLLKNFDDFVCIDEFNNSFFDERYYIILLYIIWYGNFINICNIVLIIIMEM